MTTNGNGNGHPVRVLLVDDSEAVTQAARLHLEHAGYAVTVAGDLPEATAALNAVRPDVVLLDHELPSGTGFDLLGALRADTRWSDIGVIMVTRVGDPSHAVAALELGADDFMRRPFEPPELLARVAAVLRRRARPVAAGTGAPPGAAGAGAGGVGAGGVGAGGVGAGLAPVGLGTAGVGTAGPGGVGTAGAGAGGLAGRGAPLPPPPPPPPPALASSERWAQSGRDPLTGLPDRPALRRALRAAARAGLAASVVGVRVEGLRDLNRAQGEEAGDTALREAASALRAAVIAVAGGPADGGPVGRLSGATIAALVVPHEAPAVLEALARTARPGLRTAQVPVDQSDPEATLRILEDALH